MWRPAHARWVAFLLASTLAASSLTPAAAQSGLRASLAPPDTTQFPLVTLYLNLADGTGRPVRELSATSFTILEDEVPIVPEVVEEIRPGTRQVFAFHPAEGLGVRDTHGRTRYEFLQQALYQWWESSEASIYGLDDMTLVTPDGPLVVASPAAAALSAAFRQWRPVFSGRDAGLDVVLRAMDYLADGGSRPGMPGHLVFVTSLPDEVRELSLANVRVRAEQTGTAIWIVLVGPTESGDTAEGLALRELAQATGGGLTVFRPSEGLAGMAGQLLAQRDVYRLRYRSQANTSGPHNVQVRVQVFGAEALAEPVQYEANIQPPALAFVDPPHRILRASDDPRTPIEALAPTSLAVRLLATFPDGYERPLRRSELWVDGQAVSVRTGPPFDQHTWDVSGYAETGSHTVRAVVEDSLGLVGRSTELRVEVEVQPPPRGLAALGPGIGPLLAALVVLAAGVVLAVRLTSPRAVASTGRSRGRASPIASPNKRAALRPRGSAKEAEAFLVPLDAEERELPPVPLVGVDVVLGRDPSLAGLVLNDPSVAGLHARLIRQADGGYLLRDQGTAAGTWINYEQVPEAGRVLHHNDRVHIGRVAFRFRLPNPPSAREIRVRSPQDSELDPARRHDGSEAEP